VWFLSGIFLLPTALNKLRAYLTSETLLVLSLGLCFLMVILTTNAGFSPALGAFMMGSILSETREGKRIEHLIDPVKNLFAAIFFVSVGMLIDPSILIKFMGPILAITLITIFGKALSSALGVLLSGRSLRHAVQSGLSLAQIGEFSFIIAVLGVSLKVTSDFLYPIAVGTLRMKTTMKTIGTTTILMRMMT
jgi:CPA2 family monovalent cation:H+ antiporter-2